jgi:hypothetical protein
VTTWPLVIDQNGGTVFRIVMVSVRAARYLVGNPSVHPIDHVPPGVGTRFATTSQAQAFVQREFRTISAYRHAEIVNDTGQIVMRGIRDGYNATGRTWSWHTV